MKHAVVLLGVLLVAGCSVSTDFSSTTPETTTTPTTAVSVTSTTMVAPTTSTTTTLPDPEWYLVSVTAALPEGFSDGLFEIEGVDAVSTVSVGTINLVESRTADGSVIDDAPDSFTIPLEAQTLDPEHHSEFVPLEIAGVLSQLEDGEAVVSSSSSAFRGLGEGAEMVLDDGTALNVIGVVADEWIGAAEVVLAPGDAERLGVTTERYSVVRFDGSLAELERLADETTESRVRVKTRDEVDVFRHADAVAAQITIKERFGEFAYRPLGGDKIEIDPAWKDANIVREELPLLGEVTCHVEFLGMLREALTALERAGHDDAIDPDAFAGCWYPRLIRKRTDLSRHAWGVAADINLWNDADGAPGAPDDPRLIEALEAVDVMGGHAWTDPGPGHFEWYAPVGSDR
ncbi:MAG: M15 family metallopeptidase [Actinomycetota bacterium]